MYFDIEMALGTVHVFFLKNLSRKEQDSSSGRGLGASKLVHAANGFALSTLAPIQRALK